MPRDNINNDNQKLDANKEGEEKQKFNDSVLTADHLVDSIKSLQHIFYNKSLPDNTQKKLKTGFRMFVFT